MFNVDVSNHSCVSTCYITSIKLLRIFVNVLKSYIFSGYDKSCEPVGIHSFKRLYDITTINFRKKLYPKFNTKTNENIRNIEIKTQNLASDVEYQDFIDNHAHIHL